MVQLRRNATTAGAAASSYVPLPGEPLVALDTGEIRTGDGTRPWSSLPSSRGSLVVVNVRDFGAKGDGVTDDIAAEQAAYNAAKSNASGRGSVLYYPPGNYARSAPLILSRTGSSPVGTVKIRGAGDRLTLLTGLSSFPANRALIEWEAVTSRAWHQEISNLAMRLPLVAGTRAVWYRRNLTGTALADFNSERMQITMQDVLLEGNNAFHQSLVRLEGQVFYSKFERVYGDNALSSLLPGTIYSPVSDVGTVTFEFDTSTHGEPVSSDITGLSYSTMLQCGGGSLRRGGRGSLVTGKLKATNLENTWCDGARDVAGIDLVNSFNVHMRNCNNEGRSAPQIRLQDCSGVTVEKMAPSSQDPDYPDWEANKAYTTAWGVVVPGWRSAVTSAAPANNNWYACTTAGTSGATQPTWPTTVGATVTDGTATWTCMGAGVEDAIVINGGRDNHLEAISAGPGLPNFSARGVKMIRLLNVDGNTTATHCACPGNPTDEISWNINTGPGEFVGQRNGQHVHFGRVGSIRPSASAVGPGYSFFDTTLSRPIFSTGSVWVDATGTTV